MHQAKEAEAQIQGPSLIYELCQGLVQRMQIAAVQSLASYGAENYGGKVRKTTKMAFRNWSTNELDLSQESIEVLLFVP